MTAPRRRTAVGEHPAGVAQGRARCGGGGAQGLPGVGRSNRIQPRPDPLPRGGGARVAAPIGSRPWGSIEARSRRRSTCCSTTPAGPTSSTPVLGGVNPVAAPFLSFSLPEPTGVVGVVAPDRPPLLGLLAEVAPALAAGNSWSRSSRTPSRSPASTSPRHSVCRTSRRAWSTSCRDVARSSRARSARTEISTRSSTHPATPNWGRNSTGSPQRRSSESARLRCTGQPMTDAIDDALARIEAVIKLKTAWHPVGA